MAGLGNMDTARLRRAFRYAADDDDDHSDDQEILDEEGGDQFLNLKGP